MLLLWVGGLGRRGEGSDRLDADYRRHRSDLKSAPGLAEVLLDGADIEPPCDLLGSSHGEVLAGGVDQAAAFELVLKCRGLGFSALEHCVGVAERVGKRFVGQIVKTGCDRRIGSLSHGIILRAWVRAAWVLPTPWRPDYFVIPLINGQVNTGYPKKARTPQNHGPWRACNASAAPSPPNRPRRLDCTSGRRSVTPPGYPPAGRAS